MPGKEYNMDLDWRFKIGAEAKQELKEHSTVYLSVKSGVVAGFPGKDFADGNWERVDLPHDYFAGSGFSADNSKPHGYRDSDDAWYRKSFRLDKSGKDKAYTLLFEGIAGVATVYLNGFLIGKTSSTYCEYAFDITDYVYCDDRLNVLAVNIDGSPCEGWWYEGAGIYRHVRLFEKELTHIMHNGIFAKPVLKKGSDNDWTVELEVTAENRGYENSEVYATAEIYFGGERVAYKKTETATATAGSNTVIMGSIDVWDPARWDIDTPNLYEVKTTLWQGDKELDCEVVKIGFRTIAVDADHGFFLNGRKVLIKGTCNHQDHAGVGVALSDSLHYWRVKRLKEMGTNAYRSAHNMPAKEILNACDELGMLVMDENRHFQCDPVTLSQVECMIRRDRNHPSVVFWSLFNEEPLQGSEEGARVYRRMKQFVKTMDDSRFVTGAINGRLEGSALEMDIAGLNYFLPQADIAHEKYPNMPIIGSENNSAVTTRGCYLSDREGSQVLSNYDEETPSWGSTVRNMWRFLREREYFAGIFIWTGFDYRGEPTPFDWPSVSSQFGILDTCGFAKDSFYYNRACFVDEPLVHLLPHWTWKNGEKVRVVAVTNCDEAELFLNGRSLGKKSADVCEPPEWQVEFEVGEITAKAYRNGECVATDRQVTAKAPYAVVLSSNRDSVDNDGQDTILINASVVDENGVLVPDADDLITFKVIGDGTILGTGNGDPNSHEIDTKPYRLAFHGLCQAVVRANEKCKELKIIAESNGLKAGEIVISVRDVPTPNYMRSVLGTSIGGFTVSESFAERPDPLMTIDDNDMNTFTPFVVPPIGYQRDFHNGWRIYRAKPILPAGETGKYVLDLPDIKGDNIEVYINGEQFADTSYPTGGHITVNFDGAPEAQIEIRIMIYADNNYHGCGISKFVKLTSE